MYSELEKNNCSAQRHRRNGAFGSSGWDYSEKDKRLEEKQKLREEAAKNKGLKECKIKALKLLAIKDFTELSLTQRLIKDGFSENDVQMTVAYAVESRYVNDMRFAKTFIEQKSESGWGKTKIENELQKLGIDCQDIPGFPDEYFSYESEIEKALNCLARHHTSSKNPRDAQYRYLISKGYSASVCTKALNQYFSN